MNRIGYFMPPAELPRDFAPYCHYTADNAVFSPPECTALIALASERGFGAAAIGSPGQTRVDESYRKVDVATLPFDAATEWLYERVTWRILTANQAYWNFDLAGLLEPFQVLRYVAAQGADEVPGHYDSHQDFGAGYMGRRKLSFVAQLSAASEYTGCTLTVHHHRAETLSFSGRGEAVLFPSWTPHMVSPITSGVRYAIVNWIHGPPFK